MYNYTETDNFIIGHSLRFFKKASDIDLPLDNNFFDFITFGGFDGIKLYPIKTLNDFSKGRVCFGTGDDFESSRQCAHCDRQILNLLKLKEKIKSEKDEIKESVFSAQCDLSKPIIAILMITSNTKNNIIDIASIKDILKPIDSIVYEIFNVLSSEDRIIVIRAKSINDVYNSINNLKKAKGNNCINFHTVIGVFRDISDNWIESEKIYASIRLHIRPIELADNFLAKMNEDEIFIANYNANGKQPCFMQTNGKYDIAVRYPLNNTSNFLELFEKEKTDNCGNIIFDENGKPINNAILSPQNTNPYANIFISSNTIFCNEKRELGKYNEEGVSFDTGVDGYTWEKLLHKTFNIDSGIIKRAAIVLSERVHLIKHSVFSHKYFKIVYDFTENYLDKIGKFSVSNVDIRKQVLEQIASINLFIDNIYSYSYRDFDSPQKDIRIVVDAGKYLILYSEYAEKLLKHINNEYKALVVPNVNEIIEHISSVQTKTFIAKIPEDTIFDIKSNLPLIYHEVGHCFSHSEDKYSVYKAFVIYSLIHINFYPFYKNNQYNKQQDLNPDEFCEKLYNHLFSKITSPIFYDDFAVNINEWNIFDEEFIYNCVSELNSYITTENDKRKKRKGSVIISEFNYRKSPSIENKDLVIAYEETFADRFTIMQLGVSEFKEYFLFLSDNLIKGETKINPAFIIRLLALYKYFNKGSSNRNFINFLMCLPKEYENYVKLYNKAKSFLDEGLNDDESHFSYIIEIINQSIEKNLKHIACDNDIIDSYKTISKYHDNNNYSDFDACESYLESINKIFGFY
ncbi:MAG: hypothetical protein FWG70_09990 [Oscillospiraceae bacterium]|nr:hypothetical protein [Oscillospiraceae bacterium]